MIADLPRELAEALPESLQPVGVRFRYPDYFGESEPLTGYGKQVVDALLPTVRNLIAEGLRAAEEAVKRVEALTDEFDARSRDTETWTPWERSAYGDAATRIRAALAPTGPDPRTDAAVGR